MAKPTVDELMERVRAAFPCPLVGAYRELAEAILRALLEEPAEAAADGP